MNEGFSLRAIAAKLALNREFVRSYKAGNVTIEDESDSVLTENDRTPNMGSRELVEGVPQEIGVTVCVADLQKLRQQVREDLDKFKEQIPTDITNHTLFTFRRDTIGECKGVLSELLVKIQIEIDDINKKVNTLNETVLHIKNNQNGGIERVEGA